MEQHLDRLPILSQWKVVVIVASFEYEVEGLYGQRQWDHIVTEDTPEAARETLREYDVNEPQFRHRVRKVAVKDPAASTTYKVVRFFQDDDVEKETVLRGLTMDEAQAHCKDPESSSRTATSPEALMRTEEFGAWFDGWSEE